MCAGNVQRCRRDVDVADTGAWLIMALGPKINKKETPAWFEHATSR